MNGDSTSGTGTAPKPSPKTNSAREMSAAEYLDARRKFTGEPATGRGIVDTLDINHKRTK